MKKYYIVVGLIFSLCVVVYSQIPIHNTLDFNGNAIIDLSSITSPSGTDLELLGSTAANGIHINEDDGFVMIGATVDAVSHLDVDGNLTIGATFGGTDPAPSNGAIIEGTVSIGIAANDLDFATAEININDDRSKKSTGFNIMNNNNTETEQYLQLLGTSEKGFRLSYTHIDGFSRIAGRTAIRQGNLTDATSELWFGGYGIIDEDIDYTSGDTQREGIWTEYGRFNSVGGTLYSVHGIRINKNVANSEIDGNSNGTGSDTTYIGNAAISTAFTGFHYYYAGDIDLKAGEAVSLRWVGGIPKIFRSNDRGDKRCIGIFQGVSSWTDSLGNSSIKSGTLTYTDRRFEKPRNIVLSTGQPVKLNGESVTSSDFAYSVAVSGDSYEEHDTHPLTGANVTIQNGIIENGDFLQSSSRAGYLEKWDGIDLRTIVAQSRQSIVTDRSDVYLYLKQ